MLESRQSNRQVAPPLIVVAKSRLRSLTSWEGKQTAQACAIALLRQLLRAELDLVELK
jgi:hypothetical protein